MQPLRDKSRFPRRTPELERVTSFEGGAKGVSRNTILLHPIERDSISLVFVAKKAEARKRFILELKSKSRTLRRGSVLGTSKINVIFPTVSTANPSSCCLVSMKN
jgi:hypothetical protein